MTTSQEDFALRSCHPLYREWCREEDDDYIECEDCGSTYTEQDLESHDWHCPLCKNKIGD